MKHLLIYDVRRAARYAELLQQAGFTGRVSVCRSREEAAAHIAAADVLWAWRFPMDLLPRAQNLRWIQSLGAGVEDWLGQVQAPVQLTRVVGLFGPWMAEYLLGHLLADTQGLRRVYQAQAARAWEPFTPQTLRGKRLGIAGLGQIGAEVARRARPFGLHLSGLSRTKPTDPSLVDAWYPEAERLAFLEGLDYLAIVLPLTPATRGLFGARELAALPGHAVVLNVGRGPVLSEAALIDALKAGRLRGAVLDVFEREPLPPDHPLWAAPGVTITPHISAPSVPEEVFAQAWENLQRWEQGLPLAGTVDFTRGY